MPRSLIPVAAASYGNASAGVENGLHEQALRTLDKAQRAGSATRVRTLADDPLADGLVRVAEQEQTDLIVGSSHHGTLGRVVPGSIPELLLPTAACPIAVASYGYATGDEHPLRRIGVAFDDAPEAHVALSIAAELAHRARSHVTVTGTAGAHAATLVANPLAAIHYPGHVERIREDEERLVHRGRVVEGDPSTTEPHSARPERRWRRSRPTSTCSCSPPRRTARRDQS